MAWVFEAIDPAGRRVRLSEDRWQHHILPRRPFLRNFVEGIQAAIVRPQVVQTGNRPFTLVYTGQPIPWSCCVDTLAHMWVDYDQGADIFYVRLRSDIQDARTDEAGHGVLVDRDPATGEVLGIEILDFLGHFVACRDLAWLGSHGIADESLRFLRQKAHELQQSACSQGSMSSSSE